MEGPFWIRRPHKHYNYRLFSINPPFTGAPQALTISVRGQTLEMVLIEAPLECLGRAFHDIKNRVGRIGLVKAT